VIASRASSFAIATVGSLIVLAPVRCDAQWWRSTPVDFESCADVAEKAKTKEEKTAKLAECNAKFAGRRKHGGGYTYFDFMQNRSFDIAGPNPTPEEQKKIDEQYTAYLDRERASHAATASAQQELLQQASLRSEKVPTPVQAPKKRVAPSATAPSPIRPRAKATDCRQDSFSCEWPRLSESLNGLKKLFSPSPGKPKRRTAFAS
jgi:hypothetical protein